MRLLISVFFLIISITVTSQTPWNGNSFKFSRDTISAVDMTGATSVAFTGEVPQPVTSGLISFPSGFSFRYGLNSFSTFAVSRFGFIRLGNDIVSNTPELQDNVIVPICNGTYWSARYKITGVAPDRKMIIEWSASMQPTGEPTKFQLWLSERIGKIEFVYQSVGGFYGFPALWNYKVFCKTSIMQQSASASVPVVANNLLPVVNYSAIIVCHDSIYPKTRYIFQPDTIRPANPSSIGFTNIMAGCLTVQINDNSTNESLFQLERSDDNINFFPEKKIFVASPASTGNVIYNQTGLQPFWTYRYRVFASNGFLNSDTLISSPVQSLMPQINGIKQIPGDYPSITALIQDAACKHLGPDLVIELQNNYSIGAETLPITIPKSVQTRLINSITIRPAANASINWTASTNTTLFFVDSVKHVILDGRPGGTGTSRNFTIFQQKPSGKAIQYFNAADSGIVRYCQVILKNPSNQLTSAIVVGPKDSTNSQTRKNVNYFTLSNCVISADDLSVIDLVSIRSTDSVGSKGLRIENNEFSRFVRDAIYIENGADNALITGNKFYQPVPIAPYAPLPIAAASCIKAINTEKIRISDNFFGGSTPNWGQGKYSIAGYPDYHFIHYQNTSRTKQAEIVNNKFGNIYINNSQPVKIIYASGGAIKIDSNRVGTADSLYSITSRGRFWGFDLWYGSMYVTNNFFSGLHAQYPDINDITESYFITTGFNDLVNISNNDIGGSDNYYANTTYGPIHPISGPGLDSLVVIRSNQIRGMFSRRSPISAIDYNMGLTNVSTHLTIDSNSIHHIRSAADVIGIDGLVRTETICRVSNNEIYSLYTTGDVSNLSFIGNLTGISFRLDEYPYQIGTLNTPELHIYGNRIHSLEPIRVLPGSKFNILGVSGSSGKTHAWNNDIRLGINALGQSIDSVNSFVSGMLVSGTPNRGATAQHNSVYIGGRGNIGYGMSVSSSTSTTGQKNVFVTNNIIQVDRNIPDNNYPAYYSFQYTQGNSLVSAKNLWYSASLPNINTALDAYKQACNCDSSSFIGNPAFMNPAGDSTHYDLRPGAGSMADSAGTVPMFPINQDIDALVRSNYSPVDIGSHAASPCNGGVAPLINITIPVGDTIFLCSGPSATITASVTGGSFQQLQWQRNLNNISGATSTSLIVTSPGLYRLVGKNPCMQVAGRTIVVVSSSTNNAQPSVSISASSTTICAGASVTFTATPTNPGAAPIYQWQVNGVNVGTNSPVFTTTALSNNAQVKVLLTNTTTCNPNSTATSNIVTITINPMVVPSITIDGPFFVIQGQFNTYVAFVNNQGNAPALQWQDSTNLHDWQSVNGGATQGSLSYSPALTGNKLRCRLTSNANCANPTVVFSPPITFTVNVSTGVGQIPADLGILIFPNPVTSKLIIDKLKLSDKWQTAAISSIDGKRKLITHSLSNQSTVEIDLEKLPAGIYILSLDKKSGTGVKQKFIKL